MCKKTTDGLITQRDSLTICRTFLLYFTILFISGCGRADSHFFSVYNRSGVEITEFTIYWNEYVYDFPPPHNSPELNGRTGHLDEGPFLDAIPSKVRCTWKDNTGLLHDTTLSVPQPREDQGDCVVYCFFVFPEQILKVKAFTHLEMRHDAQVQNAMDNIYASNGGPVYEVQAVNRTGETIKNYYVYFDEYCILNNRKISPFRRKDGLIVQNQGSYLDYASGLPYPVSDAARMEWVDELGKKHQHIVPLKDKIPADIDAQIICFTLRENDQVVLSTFPTAEYYKKLHRGEFNRK